MNDKPEASIFKKVHKHFTETAVNERHILLGIPHVAIILLCSSWQANRCCCHPEIHVHDGFKNLNNAFLPALAKIEELNYLVASKTRKLLSCKKEIKILKELTLIIPSSETINNNGKSNWL